MTEYFIILMILLNDYYLLRPGLFVSTFRMTEFFSTLLSSGAPRDEAVVGSSVPSRVDRNRAWPHCAAQLSRHHAASNARRQQRMLPHSLATLASSTVSFFSSFFFSLDFYENRDDTA